jgi:hypothetical protein
MSAGTPSLDVETAELVVTGRGQALVRLVMRFDGPTTRRLPAPLLVMVVDGVTTRIEALPGGAPEFVGAGPESPSWRGGYRVDATLMTTAELAAEIPGVGWFALPPLRTREIRRAPSPPATTTPAALESPDLLPGQGDAVRGLRAQARDGLAAARALEDRLVERAAAAREAEGHPVPGDRFHGRPESLTQIAESLLDEARHMRLRWEELDALLARLEAGDRGAGVAPERPARRRSQEDPARLMAMELAREGNSRAQTTEYLERTFGLHPDPATLDEIFPGEPG